MTGRVQATSQKFVFDGVQLQCERKSKNAMVCNDGEKDLYVIMSHSKFVVYDQFDPPHATHPSIILENGMLLRHQNQDVAAVGSQEFQRMLAKDLLAGTQNLQDSFSLKVSRQALDFLKKTPDYKDNVNVVLSNNETLNCKRGESSAFSMKETTKKNIRNLDIGCTYYSCNGKDPKEKILFFLPPPGSLAGNPTVLAMKDGQARYFDHDFSILDNSNSVLRIVNKPISNEQIYFPANPLNPDLFIPSKYNASRTSYNYLQSFALSAPDPFGFKSVCKDKEINKLFNEEKKIAKEMNDYLAYADIIAFLTQDNGNIRSFYIDRLKALKIGCSFQDKILDKNTLQDIQRIKDISGVSLPKKYLSEKEIQSLFKKAQDMKDIPFGYKYDGCFARAHVMARRFEEMGITVKKAWIKGDLQVPGTDIYWSYHVAPLIEAKDNKGKIIQYVIDPSLTDKAVTLDEWAATMDKSTSGPIMKTRFPIPENGLDFQRTILAVSSSDPYLPVDIRLLTEKMKMDTSRETLAEFTEVLKKLKK